MSAWPFYLVPFETLIFFRKKEIHWEDFFPVPDICIALGGLESCGKRKGLACNIVELLQKLHCPQWFWALSGHCTSHAKWNGVRSFAPGEAGL